MRKLIVTNIVSLDGYFEGPGGNVMALPMDHTFDSSNAERLRAADTLLLGRKTFEMFQGFWPAVADNANASADNREISRLNGAMAKVVVSDSLAARQTGAWGSTTEVVRRAAAHAYVADLKRKPGKDVLVFGSSTLWNDLLAAGLVDELHLMVAPVVLGGRTPAFRAGTVAAFHPVDVRRWQDSGNTLIQYRCAQ